MSVHFGNGQKAVRTSGLPTTTASHTVICVFQNLSQGTDFMQVFEVTGSGGIAFGIDSDEVTANAMGAYLSDGGVQALDVTTANFTGWVGVAFVHTGGTNVWTVYKVLEGDTAATNVGDLNTGHEGTYTAAGIGDDAAIAADVNVTAFGFFNRALTATEVYQTIVAPSYQGAAENSWLPFNSAATAGTNVGTAGNYTVTGTPTDAAAEPDWGNSDPLVLINRVNQNTLLRM